MTKLNDAQLQGMLERVEQVALAIDNNCRARMLQVLLIAEHHGGRFNRGHVRHALGIDRQVNLERYVDSGLIRRTPATAQEMVRGQRSFRLTHQGRQKLAKARELNLIPARGETEEAV